MLVSDEAGREQQGSRSRIDHMRPQPTPWQFSLRQLMLVTTACAALAFLFTVSPEAVIVLVGFLAAFMNAAPLTPTIYGSGCVRADDPVLVMGRFRGLFTLLAFVGLFLALLSPVRM